MKFSVKPAVLFAALPTLMLCGTNAHAEVFGSVGLGLSAHKNSGQNLNYAGAVDEPPTHNALNFVGSFGYMMESGLELGIEAQIGRTNNKDTFNGQPTDDGVAAYNQIVGHLGYHFDQVYVGLRTGQALAFFTEEEKNQNAAFSLNGAGVGWSGDALRAGLSYSKMNFLAADDEEMLHDADFWNLRFSGDVSDRIVLHANLTSGKGTLDYLDTSPTPVDVEGGGIALSYMDDGQALGRPIEYTLGYEQYKYVEKHLDGRIDDLTHARIYFGISVPLGAGSQPSSSTIAGPQNLAWIQSSIAMID